jgi:hypothetical protein
MNPDLAVDVLVLGVPYAREILSRSLPVLGGKVTVSRGIERPASHRETVFRTIDDSPIARQFNFP